MKTSIKHIENPGPASFTYGYGNNLEFLKKVGGTFSDDDTDIEYMDVLDKDPEALKLAKHIYSMFGSFYMVYNRYPVPDAEWNVSRDVDASKAFVSSGASITFVLLDITTFVKLNEENRMKLQPRQSPLTNALIGLYTLWGCETPVLYDVVAIGMVLWPDLFKKRPAHVKVID